MKKSSRFLVRRMFKYSAPIISQAEKRIKKQNQFQSPELNPVFIVGSPRSGTTILYQLITNEFDTLYINNLNELGRENLYFSFWLSQKFFKSKAHNCFHSQYGRTLNHGWNAPNEHPLFWDGFGEKFDKSIDFGEIGESTRNEIISLISTVSNKYHKPMIIKNFNVNVQLRVMKEMFPSAKFIFFYRDPLYTAQSILKGYWEGRGEIMVEWLVFKPCNYQELMDMSIHEKIVRYIYAIYEQLHEDLKLFPDGQIYKIRYEELDKWETDIKKNIRGFIGRDIHLREKYNAPHIRIQSSQKIGDVNFNKLKNEVDKLDWSKFR